MLRFFSSLSFWFVFFFFQQNEAGNDKQKQSPIIYVVAFCVANWNKLHERWDHEIEYGRICTKRSHFDLQCVQWGDSNYRQHFGNCNRNINCNLSLNCSQYNFIIFMRNANTRFLVFFFLLFGRTNGTNAITIRNEHRIRLMTWTTKHAFRRS